MKHIRPSIYFLAIVPLFFTIIFIIGCAEQITSGKTAAVEYTMMFQDGVYPTNAYSGTKDNHIFNDTFAKYYNYGATIKLFAGGDGTLVLYRGIIKFDVSTIEPSSVTVTSAILTLSLEACDGTPTIEAHKILQSWTEGSSNGVNGVSNWISKEAATNWATAGGSFDATSLASSTITSAGSVNLSIPASIVQSWIDDSTTNYGLLLKKKNDSPPANGDGILFYSRENTTKECHPRLTVYYNLP